MAVACGDANDHLRGVDKAGCAIPRSASLACGGCAMPIPRNPPRGGHGAPSGVGAGVTEYDQTLVWVSKWPLSR